MICSKKMRSYIYVGTATCLGVFLLAAFTAAEGKKTNDPDVVTSLTRSDAHFKEVDEVSGIAIAGFRDENGNPFLWGHNEKTSRISLISTSPNSTLYVGAITMPGNKTRDAEDIATVHDQGKGTIYLEDAGSNRKDMPVCVQYARKKDHPAQCVVLDSVVVPIDKKSSDERQAGKAACITRGSDWIWLDKSDYLAPGIHPAIRRMPEPTYTEVMRGKLIVDTDIIEFDYPRLCGDKPCREMPGNKMSDIAAAYNTEALAVVVEPDHSHTAYLFTKAPLILTHQLKNKMHCKFDSDGLSDVFRIRHIDTLSSKEVHVAEYVTTLDFFKYEEQGNATNTNRVTAANFLQLSSNKGLLLIRTNESAYKWPISLTTEKIAQFDIASALKNIKPLHAAVPATNELQGIGAKNQEAAAQFGESSIYYMTECKDLPSCSVALIRDNHPYLPGDVDGNGRIDGDDIELLGEFISGKTALYCQAAADVNGDNKITAADLEYLKKYVEGQGTKPVKTSSQASDLNRLSCGYYSSLNNLAVENTK